MRAQGDRERDEQLSISPLCDRNRDTDVNASQVTIPALDLLVAVACYLALAFFVTGWVLLVCDYAVL